jgi:hypothetical protein
VKVGVVLLTYGTVGQEFHVKGLSSGQTRGQAQAVVNTINAQGGIAGHPVQPVYYTDDITNGNYSVQAQAICAAFTQDTPVFAVVGSGIDMATLASCLAQRHTPFIPSPWVAASIGFVDDQQISSYEPYFYFPNQMDPRNYAVMIDRWVADGFLTHTSRIGILRADEPQNARTSVNVVRPRLATHGLQVVDEIAVHVNNSVSDISGSAAEASSAVLRFKAERIDRIIWIPEGSGGEAFFFMPEADNQHYYPRYAVTSWLAPYFLETNESTTQLTGSEGFGWQPSVDVDLAHDPGPTPGRRPCLALMRHAGQTFADPGVENAAYAFCESFFFLQAALVGRTPTAAALQAGAQALGPNFPSVLTFGERFEAGRVLDATVIRALRYVVSCSCYQYTGPLITLG